MADPAGDEPKDSVLPPPPIEASAPGVEPGGGLPRSFSPAGFRRATEDLRRELGSSRPARGSRQVGGKGGFPGVNSPGIAREVESKKVPDAVKTGGGAQVCSSPNADGEGAVGAQPRSLGRIGTETIAAASSTKLRSSRSSFSNSTANPSFECLTTFPTSSKGATGRTNT